MLKTNDLPYREINYCVLFNLLKDTEISGALTYMLTGKVHQISEVIPLEYSIELKSESISVSVVLYVDYVAMEHPLFINQANHYCVTFNNMAPRMQEFKDILLVYIDKNALMNYVIYLTENDFGRKLIGLKNLKS